MITVIQELQILNNKQTNEKNTTAKHATNYFFTR